MTATATPEVRDRSSGFRIDEEFEHLCPRLTSAERELLAASLVAHGVREPLVVWREERVLLDGHTRLALCDEHEIPYAVVEYSFADRAAARRWIVDNALARRNLSEEQQRYLRGKRLLVEKRQGERTDLATSRQSGGRSQPTAVRIAEREGVSPRTVERDAQYAADVDAIAAAAGPDAKDALLDGSVKATRAQVHRAAAERPQSLTAFRRIVGDATPPVRAATDDGDGRDHVATVNALARRTAAAMRSYARSQTRPEDRERLTELWALRSDIERLFTYLEGDTPCN